jgi:hypothetical protein
LAQGKDLIDERYLRYGQLVWMAVPLDEYPQRGKSIVKTRMKPVILTYLAAEDIETIRHGFTSRQLRINRMVRWCYQAYDQGGLLTQLRTLRGFRGELLKAFAFAKSIGFPI